EAKAQRRPWTRQRDFSSEIAPDDMADTAAVYAQAAGEASGAGELAERATEVGSDAGGLDGESLVDGDGRIDATARGLQGNGRDMDGVVDYLVRSMNRAIEADEEVFDLVLGDGGLEEARTRHVTAAVNEWNGWQSALEAAVPTNPFGDSFLLRPIVPLDVSYGGRTLSIAPEQDWSRAVYSLPASLATEIREKHLGNAAEDAVTADGEITDAIEAYRTQLAEFGAELQGLGYDLSGPLGLWTTEEMAEYSAGKFLEELRKDDPDQQLLAMYSQGLEGIADAVYGDSLNPGEPSRRLTAAELAYLEAFIGRIDDPEVLASLATKIEGWDESKVNLANGIAMLADPELGGHDPSTEAGRQALPEFVRRFVYDDKQGGLYPIYEYGPTEGQDFIRELALFNQFGDLMSHTVVPPGDQFAKDMARTAVDIQGLAQLQPGWNIHFTDYVTDTGSSDLLTAVSRNSEASAALLTDDDFRSDFLNTVWHESDGAADLIRSGALLPAGVDHNDPAAAQYTEAAYRLLSEAGDHRQAINADTGVDEALWPQQGSLERAIGDVTLKWMDHVSAGSQEGGYHASSDPDGDNPWTARNRNGRDHLYSFELTGAEREGLFRVMNESDEETRQAFFEEVGRWQRDTATGAFLRDEASGHNEETSTMRNIARVAGTQVRVQDDHDVSDYSKQQYTTYGAISLGASVANTLVDFGKFNAVTTAAAYGITEGLRYGLPAGNEAVAQAQWDAENYGDGPLKKQVAQAAVDADYDGAASRHTDTLPREGDENFRPSEVFSASETIAGDVFPHYQAALIDGYNDAIEPKASGGGQWSRPAHQ
ncbi:hypothetical protein, partial [Streptomyces hainanensis]|uniref:TPR repeat region-containing protein n=1 Tax=Streptomyces hainanensis TaxID=402648 RepID=UPI001404B189